jgi:hypothetical protein
VCTCFGFLGAEGLDEIGTSFKGLDAREGDVAEKVFDTLSEWGIGGRQVWLKRFLRAEKGSAVVSPSGHPGRAEHTFRFTFLPGGAKGEENGIGMAVYQPGFQGLCGDLNFNI